MTIASYILAFAGILAFARIVASGLLLTFPTFSLYLVFGTAVALWRPGLAKWIGPMMSSSYLSTAVIIAVLRIACAIEILVLATKSAKGRARGILMLVGITAAITIVAWSKIAGTVGQRFSAADFRVHCGILALLAFAYVSVQMAGLEVGMVVRRHWALYSALTLNHCFALYSYGSFGRVFFIYGVSTAILLGYAGLMKQEGGPENRPLTQSLNN